jgi:uncharacterized membrane protein
MTKLREFIKSTLVGGLLVLLPMAIFVYVLMWVFDLIVQAIDPLTKVVMKASTTQGIVADIVAIGLLIWVCFLVGMFVRTRLGKWSYAVLESKLLRKTPGYSLIKETVSQFLGNKQSPFSSVALARIFGNDTLASVFITDTHEDGSYTVFMPTGPNPTSGNIYHLQAENVIPVDVSVEDTMRSIISCGAGSSTLIAKFSEIQQASAQAPAAKKEP